MEAHNGLSAKIAAASGFPALWASGLTMSAGLGVRDANEASWTQVLDIVEFMVDAVEVPILMDGDTGFGNFNNVRRLVRKLCNRGVAGVCLEDKTFPKTNSFASSNQDLVPIEEFVGKIKAAKDSQNDPFFSVVARLESFIVGESLAEALDRASAYHEAGADAILVHSKRLDAQEILAFAAQWGRRSPLIAVPTTYANTKTSDLTDAGVSAIIWANQSLRAAVASMTAITTEIYEKQSVSGLEDRICTIERILALSDFDELIAAEKKYLVRKSSDD